MKSLTRILGVLFGIILFSLLVVSYPTHTLASEAADDPNTITISGDIPKDIFSNGKPASEATLTQSAIFAWKEFIALNWPADPNHRGLLDTNSFFGSDDKPLVWETLRNKVEIYPGDSKKAKDPFDNGSPSENGPHYYYSPEEIDSCDGNTPFKNPFSL
ncbi:hypothetical protein [Nostoc sp. FACHB-133]|uniref:hypothetical protein n=1 Tax=Nostoc sp. FACHB-133 TaxID=2692835 RepID=UPI00168255EB|nr:hypothetical protein [Nostoc sp. FACHB-133]MBD2525706.1 hypothetical protein [Nostoc sp. FACHB-133]